MLQELTGKVCFAPIGLIEMYNSGGAVEDCTFNETTVTIKARGSGLFGAYSSIKPSFCTVNHKNEEFTYRFEDGFLRVNLGSDLSFQEIEILY